jgi:hypothetical protein
MAAYPVTLTHPESGATYVASTRLELVDALANGWQEQSAEPVSDLCPMPSKASKKKASSPQAAESQG